MYAIVDIVGQQYRVEKKQKLVVNRLGVAEGDKVAFDQVFLMNDGKATSVGTPTVGGICVTAKVLRHIKGEKVIVFKKKRRKGYKVKNGHRQYLSEIEVVEIGKSTGAKSISAKKEEVKKEVKKPAKPVPAKEVAKKPVAKAKAETKKAETVAPKKKVASSTAAKKTTPKAKPSKGDDLKKIEGVGPKIAELMAAKGITDFETLSKTKATDIKSILDEAGSRYAVHDPTSWPKQAKMAADGKWDELKVWQDEHKGGKE